MSAGKVFCNLTSILFSPPNCFHLDLKITSQGLIEKNNLGISLFKTYYFLSLVTPKVPPPHPHPTMVGPERLENFSILKLFRMLETALHEHKLTSKIQ